MFSNHKKLLDLYNLNAEMNLLDRFKNAATVSYENLTPVQKSLHLDHYPALRAYVNDQKAAVADHYFDYANSHLKQRPIYLGNDAYDITGKTSYSPNLEVPTYKRIKGHQDTFFKRLNGFAGDVGNNTPSLASKIEENLYKKYNISKDDFKNFINNKSNFVDDVAKFDKGVMAASDALFEKYRMLGKIKDIFKNLL